MLVDHEVKVRTKVAHVKGKKTTCAALEGDALSAKAVHNRTTPQVDEDEDEAEESVEDEESLDERGRLDVEEELDEDEDSTRTETDVEETDEF